MDERIKYPFIFAGRYSEALEFGVKTLGLAREEFRIVSSIRDLVGFRPYTVVLLNTYRFRPHYIEMIKILKAHLHPNGKIYHETKYLKLMEELNAEKEEKEA